MTYNTKIVDGKETETVVIQEEKVIETPTELTEEGMKTAGFSSEEIKMAKRQGQIKEPVKKPELKPDETSKENTREELEKKIEEKGELEPTEEAELIEKYNRNERGLYFKRKNERKKRQEAQSERDILKIKNAQQEKELEELRKKVDNPSGEAITNEEDQDPDRLITVAELDKREKDKQELEVKERERNKQAQSKLNNVYTKGQEKYADFNNTMELAKIVLDTQFEKSAKVRAFHDAYLTALASDSEDSEEAASDIAYEIGKLHPDYKAGTSDKSDTDRTKSDKTKLNRILANNDKSKPSAAIGGSGGGNKIISEEEMTATDGAKLSQSQWNKLKPATKERLLREVG